MSINRSALEYAPSHAHEKPEIRREQEDATREIIAILDRIEQNRSELGRGRTADVFFYDDPERRYSKICAKLIIRREEGYSNDALEEMELLDDARQNGVRVPHPICSYKDQEGKEFLIMETINGPSIDDILKHRVEMPKALRDPKKLQTFLDQAEQEMEKLHEEARIHHRDFHSGNLMVGIDEETREAEPVIIDLGTAKKGWGDDEETYTDVDPRGKTTFYPKDKDSFNQTRADLIKFFTKNQNEWSE